MPPSPPSLLTRCLPALALIVLSCIWGYTWVLVKQGLDYASPFALAAQRCIGGTLALILAVRLAGKSMQLVAPGITALIGVVQVTGFTMLQTSALVECKITWNIAGLAAAKEKTDSDKAMFGGELTVGRDSNILTTRGVDPDQVIAAIRATERMLNVILRK